MPTLLGGGRTSFCHVPYFSEAAALRISDIDVPTDPATGKIELQPEGLPRFLFVTIQRSKTDQEGQGYYNIPQ